MRQTNSLWDRVDATDGIHPTTGKEGEA